MHIDRYGDAQRPALVLLHGAGAPPASLDALIPLLDQTHHVLVPHFPGYGATPAQPAPGALDQSVTRCLEALDAIGVTRFIAAGHSFGFYRALSLARHAPERVSLLVGISAVASLPEEARPGSEGLAALARAGQNIPQLLVASWFTPGYAATTPELLALVSGWWAECDVETVIAELFVPLDNGAHAQRLAQASCPVRLLHGALDAAAPIDLARAMSGLGDHIELTELPDAGHLLHLEAPEVAARWLARALQG